MVNYPRRNFLESLIAISSQRFKTKTPVANTNIKHPPHNPYNTKDCLKAAEAIAPSATLQQIGG
ncbi:hypothetical protein LguiA_003898 [Lonicera macranthoides]